MAVLAVMDVMDINAQGAGRGAGQLGFFYFERIWGKPREGQVVKQIDLSGLVWTHSGVTILLLVRRTCVYERKLGRALSS